MVRGLVMNVARRRRTALIAAVLALVTSACRVDVTVDVEVEPDGSGTVTVTMVADVEVVEQATGLASDLRFDDLVDAGWEVTEPAIGTDGSLRVVMQHPFAAPAELNALLASLNGADGPFKSVSFARVADETAVRYTIAGTGRVDAGLASFADVDLIAAVGATPYADDVAIAGLSQSEAVVVTLRARLPGEVEQTTGAQNDGAVSWVIPLDSRPVDLTTASSASFDKGGSWSIVATVLHVLFIGWLILAALLLAYLPIARHRRFARPLPAHPSLRAGSWDDGRGDDGAWEDDAWDDGSEGSDEWGGHGDDSGDGFDDPPPRRPTFPRPNF